MAYYHSDAKHLDFVGTGVEVTGILKQIGGVVGIIDPTNDSQPVLAGELGSCTVRGTVKLNNSGVVFADGDTVGYDVASDQAVAAAGGDFDCGTCVGGAAATDAVIVLLNGHA